MFLDPHDLMGDMIFPGSSQYNRYINVISKTIKE